MSSDLRNGTFPPAAVKWVEIPKGNGQTRPLGIPTVKYRVAQTAIKLAIEPIFEVQFLANSYGFRPGRSCKDARARLIDCSRRVTPLWWTPSSRGTSHDHFEAGQRWVRKKEPRPIQGPQPGKDPTRTRGNRLARIVADLNPMLWGWFGYFKHAHEYTFLPLEGFILRRLRALLHKQEKRPGFGRCHADHQRWPNAFLAAAGRFALYPAGSRRETPDEETTDGEPCVRENRPHGSAGGETARSSQPLSATGRPMPGGDQLAEAREFHLEEKVLVP